MDEKLWQPQGNPGRETLETVGKFWMGNIGDGWKTVDEKLWVKNIGKRWETLDGQHWRPLGDYGSETFATAGNMKYKDF